MFNIRKQVELRRLPGLYRSWELGQVLKPGPDYHLEDAGETAEGSRLISIYQSADEPETGRDD